MPSRPPYTSFDYLLIDVLLHYGFSWSAIAVLLNRSAGRLRRFHREPLPDDEPVRLPTRRLCVSCGDTVMSSGSGHRMCEACRSRSASPFEPEDTGVEGVDVFIGGGVNPVAHRRVRP